jgi:MFS family permease
VTTWLLLPAVTPRSAGGPPPSRRVSVFDWRAYTGYFAHPTLSSRLWQFALFALGFAMFVSGMPLVLERRLTWDGQPFGPEQVGYAWALAGVFGVIWQGPALGRLVRRFGEARLNLAGFVAYAGGYALMGFVASIPMLVLATAVLSMGSLVRPALTSLITHAAPRDEQGAVLGLMQSLNSCASIVGPVFAGLLIEHGLLTAWGLMASATAVAGLGLALSTQS